MANTTASGPRMTVDERVVVDFLRTTAAGLPHFDAVEVSTGLVADALRNAGRRAQADRVLRGLGLPSREFPPVRPVVVLASAPGGRVPVLR